MSENASFAQSGRSPSLLSGLPQRLVQDGVISEDAANQALAAAKEKKSHFVTQLVGAGAAKPRDIAVAASTEFGVPLFDLDALPIDLEITRLVTDKLLAKHRCLPMFRRGKRLFLGVSDPTDLYAIDEIKFQTGMSVDAVVVEDDKLQKLVDKAIEGAEQQMPDLGDDEGMELDALEVSGGEDLETEGVSRDDVEDAPIVRFVNKLLLDAIRRGASDIHFEPYEKTYRVRYRIDGVLKEIAQPPVQLAGKMSARLKVMSRLDIAERRVPQDGRIKMKLSKTRAIDFRVSTCPTLYGEKIVMRILDPSSGDARHRRAGLRAVPERPVHEVPGQAPGHDPGHRPHRLGQDRVAVHRPQHPQHRRRNISTAEDPVEINLPGVNQVNVNNKVGLTFAAALRASCARTRT
jgi:type IV pilus assembly protein PilB